MEKYKLYTDNKKGRWCLKDMNDKRLYMGWGNPYKDTIYASILDTTLGAEASTELKDTFARLGFTGRPVMLSADERSCTPIKGEPVQQ